jgi:hypothetical protein
MKVGAILVLGLVLAGCEKPEDWSPTYPPEFLSHWSDRQKERFPELQTVFGPSCVWRMDNTETCFRMTEAQKWTGLWRGEFEESRFCADGPVRPAEMCDDYYYGGGSAWLNGNLGLPEAPIGDLVQSGLYRVEFIGRRTLYPGNFGHLGGYDYEIFVDQPISIRKVPDRLADMKR